MDTRITGRVWVVGDSVTTEAMFPAFAMRLPLADAAKQVFYELRPGWTEQVEAGDIVVAGRNFGLGSSRPVPALFEKLGVAALVAEQFNSLFLRNCINQGLPALTVPGVRSAFADGDTMTLDFAEGWVDNPASETRLQGDALPPLLMDILASGGILRKLEREGYARFSANEYNS
jgi:3-isopropylmalate/(R)-2-methylmalate dehydratase small subunit